MMRGMAFLSASLPGQQQWTTAGTYSFVVPLGIYSLSVVGIGAGGSGGWNKSAGNSGTGGAGGALVYTNDLLVYSGEVLTIVVGAGGPYNAYIDGPLGNDGTAGGNTAILRGGTNILLAVGGGAGRVSLSSIGGAVASCIGSVKYAGGNGTSAGSQSYPGTSGKYTAGGETSPSPYNPNSAGLRGEDTGFLYGQGGPGGSYNGQAGNAGAVRVMWGAGRAFPGAAADV